METANAIPLEGGRTTANVVRIGDTVRRPMGPHSPFVHRVLRHLTLKRFAGAPCLEGIDVEGREVVTFIPGEVPRDLATFSDAQITEAAKLLRRLHDATTDFAGTATDEVVCHGDASPCNCVFRNGVPVAFIDFDATHVGSPLDDLGYAAWLWLDLGNASLAAGAQGRRLGLFLDGYGAATTDAVAVVLAAQSALARRSANRPDVRDWALACRVWTLRNASKLAAAVALTRSPHPRSIDRPSLVRMDCS